MIRWLRSVAHVLRLLLWPMPKDLAPEAQPIVVGMDPATSSRSVLTIRGADGEWRILGEVGEASFLVADADEAVDDDDLDDVTTDEPPPSEPARDGRQPIAMPRSGGNGIFADLFGDTSRWQGPRRNFRYAPWEDVHTFLAERPRRDGYGLHNVTEPLSLICTACELEQPPLKSGERTCPYCGMRFRMHGSYVVWWRPEIEPALQWPPLPRNPEPERPK